MSDSDIVQDFLAESHENLDRLDRELVGLEKNPHDRDALASVFRTIHTIKGTCGFLGFNKLEKVTHVGESLLARLRDGQLTLSPEHTTALLDMVDAVRQMLKEIQSTGKDGDGRISGAAGNPDAAAVRPWRKQTGRNVRRGSRPGRSVTVTSIGTGNRDRPGKFGKHRCVSSSCIRYGIEEAGAKESGRSCPGRAGRCDTRRSNDRRPTGGTRPGAGP